MKTKTDTIRVHAPQSFKQELPRWLLLIALAFISLFFFILLPAIFSKSSVETILATSALQGTIALGMMFVMTTGTFDLSCGMKAALAAAVVGYLTKDGMTTGSYALAWCAGIGAAVLCGAVHGFLTVTLKIPGFISAIALRLLLQAIVAAVTNNTIFYSYEWTDTFKILGQGQVWGIPYPFIIFFVLCILCWLFMERTRTGRHIYATGANITAAKQVGINTDKMRYLSFLIGAALAAVGGILFSSRNFSTSVDMGLNLQMPAMTVCLIGATFFEPGKYNVPGCFVGTLFTSVLTTGILSSFTTGPWLNIAVQGVVFLLALTLISKTKEGGLSKVLFDL